jgi:hypothetical protein
VRYSRRLLRQAFLERRPDGLIDTVSRELLEVLEAASAALLRTIDRCSYRADPSHIVVIR